VVCLLGVIGQAAAAFLLNTALQKTFLSGVANLIEKFILEHHLRRQDAKIGVSTNEFNLRRCATRVAIQTPIAADTRPRGSASRCAYRCVVDVWACPNSLPMIGKPSPLRRSLHGCGGDYEDARIVVDQT